MNLKTCFLLVALALPTNAFPVIGSVTGSVNATIDGAPLVPNTTIFSGDKIKVRDGIAVISLGAKSRVVLGKETHASFLRDGSEVSVVLTRGCVSMGSDGGIKLRVKVEGLSVSPLRNDTSVSGEVAMVDGSIIVTAKVGKLLVVDGSRTTKVSEGKTVTFSPSPHRRRRK